MTPASIVIDNVSKELLEALEEALGTTGAKLTRILMPVAAMELGEDNIARPAPEVLMGRIEMTTNVIVWLWWSETRSLTISVLKASFGVGVIHQLCRSRIDSLRASVFDPAQPKTSKSIT